MAALTFLTSEPGDTRQWRLSDENEAPYEDVISRLKYEVLCYRPALQLVVRFQHVILVIDLLILIFVFLFILISLFILGLVSLLL